MQSDSLSYPIGRYQAPKSIYQSDVRKYIKQIAELPDKLKNVVGNLNESQLDTRYRPGGWTIRQVIHHLPDSHMNAYMRIKLALTENKPIVKPYLEQKWSLLEDIVETPIEISLGLLSYLHQRWEILLKSLSKDDLKKSFIHPEQDKELLIDESIAHYAWHGNHHLAHITNTIKRHNW